MMSGQTTTSRAFKLTVLTAAVGAGSAGAAGAATISKAPAGYVPVVFTSNVSSSQSFDTDGNGTQDFTISGGSNSSIFLAAPTSSSTFSGFTSVNSYSSPDGFRPVTSLKYNNGGGANNYITSIGSSGSSSQFSPNVPMYAELATNVTYGQDANGNSAISSGTVGYILGTRSVLSGAGTSAEVDSFTINDYGVISAATAVPEPSSLALLAMGGMGVAALRRRRAQRAA